ncbi:TonB-dependent receptor domain-containing protein [Asticcacaulis sp. AC460]|uniref:TonB-dependent receptor domain-containing protein n=1 Tax=Asticcacaulis sp. AC460 TaxID=1282360 RepID=UPI0004CF057C|nr:TonB-dependent receptor [Asticcacaulis sp. AC460]
MKKSNHKAWIMAGAAVAAISTGFLCNTAFAQDDTAAAVATAEENVVVVTGTRIRRPNLKSASPITTVDEREVKLQGAIAVDSFLKALPSMEAGNNENQSNNSDGTAGVNLRSLGGNRSLVLVDGQRLLPQQGVDLNFVPSTLIERTDVLTGGASSVYGSDAMSGVVNFIMRKRLDGVRVDAQYSIYQHNNDDEDLRALHKSRGIVLAPENVWDGAKYDANIAIGANLADGKGNVTGYFGYRKMEAVTQDARDYSACALFEASATSFGCGGSGNHAYGRFRPLTGPNANTEFANSKDGSKTWVPNDGSFAYNYAPSNYTLRNSERYQAGGFVNYVFNDHVKFDGSAMFMDDHSVSQVAPSAIWFGRPFTVNCDNPLMSDDQKMKLCGSTTSTADASTWVAFRAATGPGRRNDMRHTNYRFTAALSGDISDAWNYNASVLYAKTLGQFNYQNDINQDKAANALQAINSGGSVVCKGGQQGCVPIDIFSSKGPSAEAYAYIYAPTFTRNEQDILVYNAYVSGDLGEYGIRSPWAEDGIAVVLGVESRKETLDEKRDETQLAAGSANADGEVQAKEIFTEIQIPVVADKPGIHSLDFSLGYRASTFNVSSSTTTGSEKKTDTWKVEGRYAPTADILFRASYNKAMRAANISELFAAQGVGNVALIDPCADATQTATKEQCLRTGATAAQYDNKTIPQTPADVGSALGGGNPNLNPEEAKTTTFGLVFTPQGMRNFSASVDYFKIHIDGYIGTVDSSVTLAQCLNTGDPYYCGLIHRDPATGALFGYNTKGGYIIGTNLNTGFLETTGFDVTANYVLDTGHGDVTFSLVGTLLGSLETEVLPGLGSYDCKGLYGPICGQPSPEWRHNLRTTWATPFESAWLPAAVSVNWRYVGKTELSRNTDDPFLSGNKSVLNAEIEAYNYFDLTAVYNLPYNVTLRAGVTNIFDKSPPAIDGGLLAENGNGNTYTSTYDPLGRMFFIGLSSAF